MRPDMIYMQKTSAALHFVCDSAAFLHRVTSVVRWRASNVQIWELLLLFSLRSAAYLSIVKRAEGFITEEI